MVKLYVDKIGHGYYFEFAMTFINFNTIVANISVLLGLILIVPVLVETESA